MKTGIEIIAQERQRQIAEGFSTRADVKINQCGELADAAVCYAMRGYWRNRLPLDLIWPFDSSLLKTTPNDRVKELARAGALIAAEIDRLTYTT